MFRKMGAYLLGCILSAGILIYSAIHAWADVDKVFIAVDKSGRKFFSIGSNEFRPVGVNYLLQHVGAPYQSFDMFDEKTYDADAVNVNLKKISDDGYNVVRVWLKGFDPDRGFDLGKNQISNAYVDNIVDLLTQARIFHLRVILTGAFRKDIWAPKNYLPDNIGVDDNVVGGMNRLIMLPKMAEALANFYHDLLLKIKNKSQSALDEIFYFDLYNELHFDLNKPPLSSAGHYEFGGRIYNLANGTERQALMDNAAKAWFHEIIPKVKSVDPSLLVTASSFYLASSGRLVFDGALNLKGVYPVRPAVMLDSGVDLFDIHTYPSPARPGISAFHNREPGIMAAEGLISGKNYALPVIAGEFGLADPNTFNLVDAIDELSIVKETLCTYHFSGYVVWAWIAGDHASLPDNKALSKVTAPVYGSKSCASSGPN